MVLTILAHDNYNHKIVKAKIQKRERKCLGTKEIEIIREVEEDRVELKEPEAAGKGAVEIEIVKSKI